MNATKLKVGIIGLGIMGMAYARNLRQSGFEVCGFDVIAEQSKVLEACGGNPLSSPAEVARNSDVILIALASIPALKNITTGQDGLGEGIRPGTIVCEMGTLPLEAKEEVRDILEPLGAAVLDCPVSGTGAQAALRDLSVYASGDAETVERVRPVFDGFARDVRHVGKFGTGMKLKYVANLLVSIHNLATAEALLLAKQSGLDLQMVFDAVKEGAGSSRMFEVRGPMMIEENFEPATMKMDVYMKDLQLIMDHARQVKSPTPLLAASLPFYFAALAQGRDHEDTAALYGVLRDMTKER